MIPSPRFGWRNGRSKCNVGHPKGPVWGWNAGTDSPFIKKVFFKCFWGILKELVLGLFLVCWWHVWLVDNKQFHIGADYFSGSPSLEEKASLKAMFSEKNLLKQKTLKGQSMSWPLAVHNELRPFLRSLPGILVCQVCAGQIRSRYDRQIWGTIVCTERSRWFMFVRFFLSQDGFCKNSCRFKLAEKSLLDIGSLHHLGQVRICLLSLALEDIIGGTDASSHTCVGLHATKIFRTCIYFCMELHFWRACNKMSFCFAKPFSE